MRHSDFPWGNTNVASNVETRENVVSHETQNMTHNENCESFVSDNVGHPKHYIAGNAECIDIIEELGLNYHVGNAFAYLFRACKKGRYAEDIAKARWYLDRELRRVGGEE